MVWFFFVESYDSIVPNTSHKGLNMKNSHKQKRGGFISRKVTFHGKEYPSMLSLYEEEKSRIRRELHRSPAIDYAKFTEVVKRHTAEMAVWHMHQWHLHSKGRKRGLNRSSRKLGGADNLVCQRMTKLGWSYAKAVSTPVIQSRGRPIKYKGKNYPSIRACWSAVKPGCSYMCFVNKLSKNK